MGWVGLGVGCWKAENHFINHLTVAKILLGNFNFWKNSSVSSPFRVWSTSSEECLMNPFQFSSFPSPFLPFSPLLLLILLLLILFIFPIYPFLTPSWPQQNSLRMRGELDVYSTRVSTETLNQSLPFFVRIKFFFKRWNGKPDSRRQRQAEGQSNFYCARVRNKDGTSRTRASWVGPLEFSQVRDRPTKLWLRSRRVLVTPLL